MAKLSVLRPGGGSSDRPAPLASARPTALGGAENLAGSDALRIAGEYAVLYDQARELEDELDALRKKMASRQSWLVEQLQLQGAKSVSVGGRTIYQIHDLVVSKAAGVSSEQVALALRSVDANLAGLVSETFQASSLKAAVKEMRSRAIDSGECGERAYCPSCQTFFDPFHAGANCPHPDCVRRLCLVVDGVYKELSDLLYIEPIVKLGCRVS